jgi:hypothetical protein
MQMEKSAHLDWLVDCVFRLLCDHSRWPWIFSWLDGLTVDNSNAIIKNCGGELIYCGFGGSGFSIEERIVEWTKDELMTIDIYEGVKTPPFKKAGAILSVKEYKGGILVSGMMAYELKFRPIGSLMDSMMVPS